LRWTAAEVDGYLNRAMLQVVIDAEVVLETSFTASIVANQREYKMPAAFYKMESVQWVHVANTDIRELRNVSFAYYRDTILRDEQTTGDPLVYYFWRKLGDDPTTSQPTSLFVYPTPSFSTSGSNDIFRIHVYKYPDAIDSTTFPTRVVELEPPHVEAAVMWAAYLMLSDDGDGRATEKRAAYESLVEKVKSSLARKDLSRTSRMRPMGARRGSSGLVDEWIRW
jgi:hypothetical protein